MNKFNKFLEDLSKNPLLLIIWVIILIGIVWAIYKGIGFIQDKIDNYNQTKDFNVEKENLSFSNSEFQSMANQIFNAMDGAGTSTDVIYNVLGKLQTKDDYNMLVKTFGVRSTTSFISSFSGTMIVWFSDELSNAEIKKVNNILSKFGITI